MVPSQSSALNNGALSLSPHALAGGYFRLAAFLGWVLSALQLSALVLGSLVIPWPRFAQPVTLVLAAIAYSAALLRLAADWSKSKADSLLRLSEHHDALGAPPDPQVVIDAILDAPFIVRKLAQNQATLSYFSSTQPPGPHRCVENVRESAWWTARLARSMARIEVLRLAILGLLALILYRAADTSHVQGVWILANALIMVLLTLGPLRRAIEFGQLASAASRCTDDARALLAARPGARAEDALDLLARYQLARKGAPLIPTALWSIRRRALNAAWQRVISRTPERLTNVCF